MTKPKADSEKIPRKAELVCILMAEMEEDEPEHIPAVEAVLSLIFTPKVDSLESEGYYCTELPDGSNLVWEMFWVVPPNASTMAVEAELRQSIIGWLTDEGDVIPIEAYINESGESSTAQIEAMAVQAREEYDGGKTEDLRWLARELRA